MVRALQICVGILFLCSCIGHCHGYRTKDRKLNGGDEEKRFNQSPLFNKLGDSPSSSGEKVSERTLRIVKRDPELSPVQKAITIQKVQVNGPINDVDDLYEAYQYLRDERLKEEGYEVDDEEILPTILFEYASELRDKVVGYPYLPDYNARVREAESNGMFNDDDSKLKVLSEYMVDLWRLTRSTPSGMIIHTNEDHLTKENIIRSIEDKRNELRAKGEILSLVKEQDLLRGAAFNIQEILPTSVVQPKLRIMLRERVRALGRPLNEYEKTEVTWNWVQELLGLKIFISKPQRS